MSTDPNPPSNHSGKEQRLLRHARREGLLIMFVWALALFWTTAVSYVFGYRTDPNTITIRYGMPEWVLWGVVAPWLACFVFSIWFCFGYMADDDLGEDRAGGAGHG
jgi:hypothetical protein